MFSPAKAITVGAFVFALGGALLIAQPIDRQGPSAPGAATDDPSMAPSFFSGTMGDFTMNVAPVPERREDGVVEFTGESYTFSWDANDPRIVGTATIIMNETDYREGATTLAPTGDVGTMRTGVIRIVNDDGSWAGPYTELLLENADVERDSVTGWVTGSDGYEGLSAYVVMYFGGPDFGTFTGHITAEGPPPAPEIVPE